jgi:hypothetical protein
LIKKLISFGDREILTIENLTENVKKTSRKRKSKKNPICGQNRFKWNILRNEKDI